MPQPSVLSVLTERASLQPDDTAMTFIDHERDWAGLPKASRGRSCIAER
jgi:hypothetical protein